jgi:hypothetical protein
LTAFNPLQKYYFFIDLLSFLYFSFRQLADFHSVSWPIFIPSVGRFSFRQLADFHSVSWPIFIPSVG